MGRKKFASDAQPVSECTGKPHRLRKTLGVLTLIGAGAAAVSMLARKLVEPPVAEWVERYDADEYIAHPIAQPSDDFAPAAESLAAPESEECLTVSDVAAESVPGSYVGDEPGEDFTIKGNSRSRKYHCPGQVNYNRTSADIWFESPQAAQAAGFTPAKN